MLAASQETGAAAVCSAMYAALPWAGQPPHGGTLPASRRLSVAGEHADAAGGMCRSVPSMQRTAFTVQQQVAGACRP